MMMVNLKPVIRIFWELGVSEKKIKLVRSSVREFLAFFNLTEKIKVRFGEGYILSNFREDRKIYFWKRSMNTNGIVNFLEANEKKAVGNYYSLIITKNKIFFRPDVEKVEIVGLARTHSTAVVFVGNRLKILNKDHKKTIKVIVFHELGHIFGLLPSWRIKDCDITASFKHCTNCCVMHQYTNIPARDLNLIVNPFCYRCQKDLYDYFIMRGHSVT